VYKKQIDLQKSMSSSSSWLLTRLTLFTPISFLEFILSSPSGAATIDFLAREMRLSLLD
jgi:hypothetical protein